MPFVRIRGHDGARERCRFRTAVADVPHAQTMIATFIDDLERRVVAGRDSIVQLQEGVGLIQANLVRPRTAKGVIIRDTHRGTVVVDRNPVRDVVVRVAEDEDAIVEDLDA